MTEYYKPAGCPVHGAIHLSNNDISVPKLGIDQNVFNEIAKKITADTLISEELFEYTNKHLQKAITQVFGNPKYDDKNFAFAQKLRRNTTRFAGFKTAAQTRTIQKSKPERYPIINNAYNNNWLRTEYVYTVRSARSAEKWQKYLQDADIYPYLEYMPSLSAVKRSEHVRLYGIIKHINDKFWDKWYPPSDWGCKCSVQQRRTDKNSNPVPDDITLPKKNMCNNPGKTGQIFTDDHPMIKAVSNERKEKIEKQYQYLERKKMRVEALNYSIQNILKNKYKIENKTIEFSKKGIEKIINQPHKYYLEKMELLKQIEYVLSKAEYVKKVLPNPKRQATIAYTHIFKINFMKEASYLIIWEYKSGEFIFHSIVEKIKK